MTFTPRPGSVVRGLGPYDAPHVQFGGTDDYGVQWTVEKLEGWKRTDVQLPVEETAGDGGYFGPGRRPSRVLTLTGAFRGTCLADLDAAEQRFRLAATMHDRDQVLWVDEPIPKQLTIRQSGPVDVDPVPGHPRIRRFTAVFTAADPYKYAAGEDGQVVVPLELRNPAAMGGLMGPITGPITTAGAADEDLSQAATHNPGDTAVAPTLQIEGQTTNGQVLKVATGEYFGVSGELAVDVVAESDFRYRDLRIDGAPSRARRLPGYSYFLVEPGRNDFVFTSTTEFAPSARAQLTYSPRWR